MGIRNALIRKLTRGITGTDSLRAIGHSIKGGAMNAPPTVKAAGALAALGGALYGASSVRNAYELNKKWTNQEVDTPIGRGLCTEVQGWEDGGCILRVDVARGKTDTYLFRADQLTLVRELPEVPELTPKAEAKKAEEPKAEAKKAEEPTEKARASRRKAEKADDVKDAS